MHLFVDDNRDTPAGWTHAHTAEEAKLHLIHGDVDRMSIDYDLDMPHCERCQFACGLREGGCRHGCDCHSAGDENGLHLVEWMVNSGRWPKQRPEVHSHNIDGALRMKKLLQDAYPRG